MTMKVRFAPSPTGRLHVGNVRTALYNSLAAIAARDAKVLLRIDDTDQERSTKAFEDGIKRDLEWLGLTWDETVNQSERFELYNQAADRLRQAGLLYPCYETAEELDRKRKIARSRGKPPVYDRAALDLTEAQKQAYESEGRRPHWRFKLSGAAVSWGDRIRGGQTIETASISDPILIREDGSYLYTLPSCVDDIDLGVTLIIRGEDHVTNSGAQIEIFRALNALAGGDGELPDFAHGPLLVGADGSALSKRLGSLSMEELRAKGVMPMAVNSLLAKIGTSDPVELRASLRELADEFSFDKVGRAPARFDEADLARLNAQLVRSLSYADVKPALEAAGCDLGEAFWLAVRDNLETAAGAGEWAALVTGPIEAAEMGEEDRAFARAAAEALPETLNAESWGAWTHALKESTGRKGKALFMPLRLALTGRAHGPEMGALLPLIGREEALRRLRS